MGEGVLGEGGEGDGEVAELVQRREDGI